MSAIRSNPTSVWPHGQHPHDCRPHGHRAHVTSKGQPAGGDASCGHRDAEVVRVRDRYDAGRTPRGVEPSATEYPVEPSSHGTSERARRPYAVPPIGEITARPAAPSVPVPLAPVPVAPYVTTLGLVLDVMA